MRRLVIAAVVSVITVQPLAAALSSSEVKRFVFYDSVITEIYSVPDKDVPQELWAKAACVMVIPGMKKAAFVFGGEYGKGLMSCKRNGAWTAPIFMRIEKGSWGLQIGAQSIDLVLLVMNERGMEKLLGNKVSLGAEMSVAAGPVGRDARAATDVQLKAEMLSYSRTQGLFAGINLSGGVVRGDEDDNADLYGPNINLREVLGGLIAPPSVIVPFLTALARR